MFWRSPSWLITLPLLACCVAFGSSLVGSALPGPAPLAAAGVRGASEPLLPVVAPRDPVKPVPWRG